MNNVINNNVLASLTQRAGHQITNAVKTASRNTGVDFAYLMQQAAAESSFDADAQARTSSATGLYQFIESTWLNMVNKHGHKYGIDKNASRADILEQRNDPEKAAALAAEFAAENKAHLERHVGGKIGATELYFAHFMGASGATGFLNALQENPAQTAADIFPKAARANYNVFYDSKTGKARTLAGVYEFFDKKFGGTDNAPNDGAPMRTPANRGGISYEELLAQNPALAGKTMPRTLNQDLWQRITAHKVDSTDNFFTRPKSNLFHKLASQTGLDNNIQTNAQHMQLLLLAQLNR